ncbi:unnamed protein product [Mytilus edulis]|uniref:Uncharacterized protein n=1 Tax=Mytilus edulis TaxID=6550 RepID=A0A8S3TPT9_MYTED|nr:unnamed protein product [Mytilus edulis]
MELNILIHAHNDGKIIQREKTTCVLEKYPDSLLDFKAQVCSFVGVGDIAKELNFQNYDTTFAKLLHSVKTFIRESLFSCVYLTFQPKQLAFAFLVNSYLQAEELIHLNRAKPNGDKEADPESASLLFVPISWFAYSTLLAIKVGIAFKDFAFLLSEYIFFGPNTLKTTIALGGIVFALLLATNHDAKPGSPRRKYIDELTGTVIFDILDCVDSMEMLFFKEERDTFPTGVDDAIIAIALINFILPTIPLITLSKTKYGEAKLSHKLVMIHKVLLAFVVNLPLLITRMILWHGLSRGISIFSLKNVIVIGMTSVDLYETLEGGENKQTQINNDGVASSGHDGPAVESYAMEDRFNYMD